VKNRTIGYPYYNSIQIFSGVINIMPDTAPAPTLDALLPVDMAGKAETIGVNKAKMAVVPMLVLAILAGAFIALGAVFSTIAGTGASALPYGVGRVLSGLVFCLGLILVVIAGAELFTGNNLIVMAWASGKVSTTQLLRNWVIVYIGNFIGAFATAILVFASKQYLFGSGAVGTTALNIAKSKVSLDFMQAFALGVLCNALVCLAVWLVMSARTSTDKILCIVFPITAFVAAGFEHSIANMYFVPLGLFIKSFASPKFWEIAQIAVADYDKLTWSAFFINNLLPVTLGNIVGGAGLVGMVYWLVYAKPKAK
jgi:formate transporter FocA